MIIKKRQLLGITVTSLALLGMVGTPQATSATGNVEVVTSQSTRADLPKISVKLGELPVKNPGTLPFKDGLASQFKTHISWLYSRGITTGYTPTSYKPTGNVTRGEMAVFLHRFAGAPSYIAPFNVYNDVTQYKNQILWLTAAQVTTGTAPRYNPNVNVTRGQMAAFLHRIAKVSGNAPSTGKYSTHFKDIKNHMFANDIGWLSSKGITTGYTPTTFKPDAYVTRGEMAAFLYRFYNTIPKVDKTDVKVKATVLYTGDTWNKKDNFVSATDKDGQAVDFSKVSVTGSVDINKVGTYMITYGYGGKTAKATVTVKALLTPEVNVKDTVLNVNDVWNKADNFVSAKNDHGQAVTVDALTVTGSVDTSKPGTTAVTYELQGVKKVAKVTVNQSTAVINVKDSEIWVGDSWTAKDNFVNATDNQGNDVAFENLDDVAGTVDTDTAGTYEISYTHQGVTKKATVTVVPAVPIDNGDGTISFMNQDWDIIKKMGSNDYLIAMQTKISNLNFGADLFFPNNTSTTDGYNSSLIRTEINKWYNNNLLGTSWENAVVPVVLANPTIQDMMDIDLFFPSNSTWRWETDYWQKWINSSDAFPTRIDESSGKKQAFAMSASDISDASGTSLTSEAQKHVDRLTANNVSLVWLRSPGYAFNFGSVLSDNPPNSSPIGSYSVKNSGAVVPSLIVHVSE